MMHFDHVHRGEDISVNLCRTTRAQTKVSTIGAVTIPIHVCVVLSSAKLVSNAEVCECASVLRASAILMQTNTKPQLFYKQKNGAHSPSFVRLTNFYVFILPQAKSTTIPAKCAMFNGNHRNKICGKKIMEK